jgi:hypothetical protein
MINETDQDKLDYEQLLTAGAETQRYNRMMEMQKAQAAQLREDGGTAQGQMVSDHYVAPHWTQQLSNAGNKFLSGVQARQAMDSGGRADASQASQNATILRSLLRAQQQPQAPAQPAPQQQQANPYQQFQAPGNGVV